MIELKHIHQFQFVNTYCYLLAKGKTVIKGEDARDLIGSIIRWATQDDRLSEVLTSTEMADALIACADITSALGVMMLLEQMKALGAWDMQAILITHHPHMAPMATEQSLLLPGIDTIATLAL